MRGGRGKRELTAVCCVSFSHPCFAPGFGCVLSGMNYAEMSSRVPSAGSSYAYTYVALGELPAVVAGWCLTLEYGISASAIARSWGDKMINWITTDLDLDGKGLRPGHGVNPLAAAMVMTCTGILLGGVGVGKNVTNFFTGLKMLLVAFMIIGGLSLFDADNLTPFAPNGFPGIMRGATSAFFGYIGYDTVCCLGMEAKNPSRNLPLAVGGSIVGVTVLQCLAAFALVSMQPFEDIDVDSGFPEAFGSNGLVWAQHLVATGEIITLPLVVLVSLLPQVRLQFAMAEDGLMPAILSKVDEHGNLFMNIFISGTIATLIALFVPFLYLDSMISAGVLIAFNLTNISLVVVRREHPFRENMCVSLMSLYCFISFVAALMWRYLLDNESLYPYLIFPCGLTAAAFLVVRHIAKTCPEVEDSSYAGFRVPFVPWLPALGIFVNWYLVVQLEWYSLLMIIGYVVFACSWYILFGVKYSIGNANGWAKRLEISETQGESMTTGLLENAKQEEPSF
eukprot:scaffold1272_cov250-Pinguiococcus_pyrenoidosus.AAC.69